jgi:hypothetical protein
MMVEPKFEVVEKYPNGIVINLHGKDLELIKNQIEENPEAAVLVLYVFSSGMVAALCAQTMEEHFEEVDRRREIIEELCHG